MEISIIIPLYNEEKNIDELLDRLKKTLSKINKSYELILVNDGSSDGTLKILSQYQKCSDVKVLNLIKNYGQSIANRAGYEYSSGKYIVCMDGDLQHRPEDLPKIIDYLYEGYDLVSIYKDNKSNQSIWSKIAHKIVAKISKTNLKYYGISIKAFRRELLNPRDLFGNTHRFIGITLAQKANNYKEISITIDERENGISKYKNKQWAVLFELFTLKLLLKDIDGLSKYFRRLGFILGILGILGVFATIVMDVFVDINISQSFIIEFILLNFMIIAGILFFILGVVLHIYQKESFIKPYIVKNDE